MLKTILNFFYRNKVLTDEELKQAVLRLKKAWNSRSRNSVIKIFIPEGVHLETTVREEVPYYTDNGKYQIPTEYEEAPSFQKMPQKKKVKKTSYLS